MGYGMKNISVERVPHLYLRVYETLKDAIVSGEFSPGEPITETKLAKELQVSRTPIRDALRQLSKDGLIVHQDNGTAVVFAPTVSDVAEIYVCRAALEGQAAAIAAQSLPSGMTDELTEVLQQSVRANENGDVESVVNLNTQLHSKIIHASQNRDLIQAVEAMRLRILQSRRISLRNPSHRATSLKKHGQIVEEISKKNTKEVERLMTQHVLDAGSRVIKFLGIPDDPSPTISYLLQLTEEAQ
jgi:DNA-binding GntR family transcriptional regulator